MRKLMLGAICSALLLTACSAEKDDWRAAQAADTSLAYGHFVSQHPDSSHAAEARSRAAALTATEAAALTVGDTPPSAVVSPTQGDAGTPVVPPAPAPAVAPEPIPAAAPVPTPSPAAPKPVPSKPVAVKGSGYGVQIGAYSTHAKAEAQWTSIEKRFRRDVAGSAHRIEAGKAGSKAVFRLKLSQPSQAAAKALCGRLAAGGQPCVVYHP